MSQTQIIHPETVTLPQAPIRAVEPIIAVPSDIPPNIPPQYWGTETGFILALAVLIRSTALLIQVLTPLVLQRKSGSSEN